MSPQIRVKKATVQKFPEYGELYEGLCSATGEIPFAIYRTERTSDGKKKGQGQSKFPGETILEVPVSSVFHHLVIFSFSYRNIQITAQDGIKVQVGKNMKI